jgi:DNA-binding NarL/FixJ family response regulator
MHTKKRDGLGMGRNERLELHQQLAARGMQIPTVFVTAHRDEQFGQPLSAARTLAVIRKPVDRDELVRPVREGLGSQ